MVLCDILPNGGLPVYEAHGFYRLRCNIVFYGCILHVMCSLVADNCGTVITAKLSRNGLSRPGLLIVMVLPGSEPIARAPSRSCGRIVSSWLLSCYRIAAVTAPAPCKVLAVSLRRFLLEKLKGLFFFFFFFVLLFFLKTN